jgi:hypothetical protein
MVDNRFPGDEQDVFFRRNALASLIVFLAGLAAYLLYAHYVKAYSDPANWLMLGQGAAAGKLGRQAPLYPLFLAAALKLTGPFAIFLVNGPFLLLMTYLAWRITVQVFDAGRYEGRTAVYGPLFAGMVTVAVLIDFHTVYYLELLNPYREAVAFSLLLGGVTLLIAFIEGRGMAKAALAALLMGLAIGVRETCVIFLPPAVLLLLAAAVRDKGSYYLRGAGVFMAFFLVGMFLQQPLCAGLFRVHAAPDHRPRFPPPERHPHTWHEPIPLPGYRGEDASDDP